jgi:glycosyltransferase involved in cell wall biosynthesis
MLSICIPIYNFDVRPLVNELHRQCVQSGTPFEILLLDDASAVHKEDNRSLGQLPGVTYEELPENFGRARIRNTLAQKAGGEYLLFIDCDSAVMNDRYITLYLEAITAGHLIVCGGRCYLPEPPSNPAQLLRWKYGVARESTPASQRNQHPHRSFLTCNFAVQKQLMLANPFLNTLTQYGHEDTLFGFQLQQKGINIFHIDNALAHIGLEDAKEFLHKSEKAVDNLLLIYQTMPELRNQFATEVKLLRTYLKLLQSDPLNIIRGMITRTMPLMRKNLLGRRPDLRRFDLYRLGLLFKKDTTAQL